jgi:hypothetical protein
MTATDNTEMRTLVTGATATGKVLASPVIIRRMIEDGD